ADGPSLNASLSADGRYVAFESTATNLVSGDTNGASDVFLKDTVTGTLTRISTDGSGAQANGYSLAPSLSSDGRYAAFSSIASNLVSGDTNLYDDIFVKDTTTGAVVRASTDSSGVQSDYYSLHPSISANGRYVAFESAAANLVSGDTNNAIDVFAKDLGT